MDDFGNFSSFGDSWGGLHPDPSGFGGTDIGFTGRSDYTDESPGIEDKWDDTPPARKTSVSSLHRAGDKPSPSFGEALKPGREQSPSGMRTQTQIPAMPTSENLSDMGPADLLRSVWRLQTPTEGAKISRSLSELKPALLVETLRLSSDDAKAIVDGLKKNGTFTQGTQQVAKAVAKKDLNRLFGNQTLGLSESTVGHLEWLLGILFDAQKFDGEQFGKLHPEITTMISAKAAHPSSSSYGAFFPAQPASRPEFFAREKYWSEVNKVD